MDIKFGQWFLADIIGYGIYEMINHGINSNNDYFAIVRCKKLFQKGFDCRNHETTCHPITDFKKWNDFKIIKCP